MHTEGTIEIDCPIDDVFKWTNDHVADWSHVVVEEEVIEKMLNGVGSRFRSITEDRGRRMTFEGIVTEYDRPVRSRIHMTGDLFDIDAEYRFEDLGDERTRVTQLSDVNPKGMLKILFFLFGWAMRKSSCGALQAELQSLKEFCERQYSECQSNSNKNS